MTVDRSMARLHDKNVRPANVFQNLKINFAVAEAPQQRLAQRHIQFLANTLRQYWICGPRENLANEGGIVRNPNSGRARHGWAGKTTNPRRTAPRQRGFCSSSLEQFLLDLTKPGMPLENRPLEIIRKTASRRAPG